MTTPDPIVAFLTARENEREQEAREAGPYWQRKAACAADDPGIFVVDDDHSYPLVVNPAWVLADVAAKRELLADHYSYCGGHPGPWLNHSPHNCALRCRRCEQDWLCETVTTLASIWSDHPDFDPSWAS